MEILRNDQSNTKSWIGQPPSDQPAQPPLTITDLKPALRDENRVNVFVDDEFAFSLDLSQIVDLKVKKGQTLTPEQLSELRQASEFGKLYQRTLEWILTRPHSVQETKDYLTRCRKKRTLENRRREQNRSRPKEDRQKYHLKTKLLPEITEDATKKVLDRLLARGYLDDQKFAIYFVENRQTKKGISRRRLEQELFKKGITPEIIAAALNATTRDEKEELKKIIAKKRKKYQDDQKLIAYLLRQGFSYDLITSALKDY